MSAFLKTMLVLLLCTAFSNAHAQSAPFTFGIEGSISRGAGDFGDAVELGQQFGITLERQVSPNAAIGFSVGRHGWDANSEFNYALSALLSSLIDPTFDPFFDPLLVNATARYEATEYTGHVRVLLSNAPSGMRPYLQGGVGGYAVKTRVEIAGIGEEDDSQNVLGFNIGGGVDFPLNPNAMFGVVTRFHYLASEDKVGVNANSLSFGARLSFGFGR
ncbi:MAG: hypothetical protein RL721_1051 [Candidatus Eisenbacteria bacterium]|jgi:opacity protein-like surface antigen